MPGNSSGFSGASAPSFGGSSAGPMSAKEPNAPDNESAPLHGLLIGKIL